MTAADGNEALRHLVSLLNRHGVAYMLVGSDSSNAYGIPRATKDADIVVAALDATFDLIGSSLGDGYQTEWQFEFELITGTVRRKICYSPVSTGATFAAGRICMAQQRLSLKFATICEIDHRLSSVATFVTAASWDGVRNLNGDKSDCLVVSVWRRAIDAANVGEMISRAKTNAGPESAARWFLFVGASLAAEYNPRWSPPWSERELQHKINQAAAKPHDRPFGKLRDEGPIESTEEMVALSEFTAKPAVVSSQASTSSSKFGDNGTAPSPLQ